MIEKLVKYFKDNLDVSLRVKPYPSKGLPVFLKHSYELFETKILGMTVLLAKEKDPFRSPLEVKKQLDLLSEKTQKRVVYLCESVKSYNRIRLIKSKIPFIVPGNQMYLPDLGLDLREHFLTPKEELAEIKPSAQAIIIYHLVNNKEKNSSDGEYTPYALERLLNYSKATINRACRTLDNLGIAQYYNARNNKSHSEFRLHFKTPQEVWTKAEPLLKSPIKNKVFAKIKGNIPKIEAGVSALSKYSMISPNGRTLALSSNDYLDFQKNNLIEEVEYKDLDTTEIEIWNYSPNIAGENIVDRYSLYLSLKESPDERVQIALDEMMEI